MDEIVTIDDLLIFAEVEFTVEFYEVDSMEVVWRGNYARYLERARCALLNLIGCGYTAMKALGWAFPVAEMPLTYIRPLAAMLLLMISPLALFSQTDGDLWRHLLRDENRSGFDTLCEKMSRYNITQGDFVQTSSLNRLGRSLVSRGVFTVDAGRGIIWDTRTPFPSITAVGKDFVVQKSGVTTTRLDTSGDEIFIRIAGAISAIFSGETGNLTQTFELYFLENGRSWKLGLIPKDRAVKTFMRAIVMRGDSVLREVLLEEHDGDTIRYELSGHAYPDKLSADEEACFIP